MTEEDRVLLNNIQTNTRELFGMIDNLEAEKKQLEEEVRELNNQVVLLEQDKIGLGKKNEQLKIATQLLSGVDENREVKQKINTLVREIDKCIALLNK